MTGGVNSNILLVFYLNFFFKGDLFMRRFMLICLLAVSVVFVTGCGAHYTSTLQSPATGMLYNETSGAVTATGLDGYTKVGESQAKSILGLVGIGDASIGAAMEDGNISQIQSVDYKFKNILGIYATTKVIVRGK